MTLRELKAMNKEIKRLLRKIERLRSASVNISPTISPDGVSSSSHDKMAANVAEIIDCEQKLSKLRSIRDYYLDKLSIEDDTENCIWLHVSRGYSWRKIAITTDGRPDTADSIKKRCHRHEWK